MTASPDDLEQKVNLILENLKLLEEVQQQQTSIQELQEKNKKLQQEKENLEGLTKKITGPSTFPDLLQEYKGFMNYRGIEELCTAPNLDRFKYLTNDFGQVLTPREIDDFLQLTRQFSLHEIYHKTIGFFISKLIQNSYDKLGHTQFTLTTEKHPKQIDYLGVYLNGWKEEEIKISITGKKGDSDDYGLHLGFGASNVKIYCAGKTSPEFPSNSGTVGLLIFVGIVGLAIYSILPKHC